MFVKLLQALQNSTAFDYALVDKVPFQQNLYCPSLLNFKFDSEGEDFSSEQQLLELVLGTRGADAEAKTDGPARLR